MLGNFARAIGVRRLVCYDAGMGDSILSCPHVPQCSGCSLIETAYRAQLALKHRSVCNLFEQAKLRGFSPDGIPPVHQAPAIGAYRNRVRLAPARSSRARSGISLGLFHAGTHEVVDIPGCPVQRRGINETVEEIRKLLVHHRATLYDDSRHRGDLRYASVRESAHTGEQLVGLVTRSADFPQGQEMADELIRRRPCVAGVVQNVNSSPGNVIFGPTSRLLAGRDYLVETVCGIGIRLGLTSFFQVHTAVAEMAYEAIIENLGLTSADTLLDLYCGVGPIGLVAARHVAQVIGIEEVAEAVAFAESATEVNGLDNIAFHRAAVEEWLPEFSRFADTFLPDRNNLVVSVNPPRKGLDDRVVELLIDLRPSRIAYLSCAPRTLLRDLHRFVARDYRISHVELFDMFPQTEQVETLAILESERIARGVGKRGAGIECLN